jgi:dolichol kinase
VISISLAPRSTDFILANAVLGLSSLPLRTILFSSADLDVNVFHWLLNLVPPYSPSVSGNLRTELLCLLYPLHTYTIQTLEFLTTTSLDPAELYLLATALINLVLFASSPQSEILKALLWLGGISLFITCQKVLKWEVALARIPSWKLRQSVRRSSQNKGLAKTVDRMLCNVLARWSTGRKRRPSSDSEDDEVDRPVPRRLKPHPKLKLAINGSLAKSSTTVFDGTATSAIEPTMPDRRLKSIDNNFFDTGLFAQRRHTLPATDPLTTKSEKSSPSGRRRRSMTPNSHSFLSLTPQQALVRRWAYAAYIYTTVVFIILGPIRSFVSRFALSGQDPFGWALGYLLGDLPPFRNLVMSAGLQIWIRLPQPLGPTITTQLSLVEWLRQDVLGPANMRLLLCVYCVFVLLIGISAVLQLSSVAEVDTRRKVFHGIMVAMLLPTTFIDPCFIALALVLILAIFLLLDLFRASQLPPISKPLTAFLAPYVDGRDYRGPVIVSHIFLLIGCAIPLWLSLAAAPRTGQEPWFGWETTVRDVSMISGVVCVGLGDSAASLVGRRYGRHKWYWGGGKSLEGSLAFTAAVTAGLTAAYIWLRVGGWVSFDRQSPVIILGKICLAASGASLTEAVLTGANDNVVVPIVLWLLVRGLNI